MPNSRRSSSSNYDRIKHAKELSVRYSEDLFSYYIGNVGERNGDVINSVPNPFRPDKNLQSSAYYIDDAKFCDFGKGGEEHDWIDYLVHTGQASGVADAANIIIERFGNGYDAPAQDTPAQTEPAKKKTREWQQVKPIPERVKDPSNAYEFTNRRGETLRQVAKWAYHDERGQRVGYVVRFDKFDSNGAPIIDEKKGKPAKEFRPLIWAEHRDTGKQQWKMLGFDSPRPLYALPQLLAHPDAKVLIVSGEKCADAANAVFERTGWSWVAISWQHGDGGKNNTDWTPTHGRRLAYWPDNDEGGKKAIAEIKKKLNGTILPIPQDMPQGWDIADAIKGGWTDEQIIEFIEREPEPITKPAEAAANDNVGIDETLADNRYFSAEGISTKGEGAYLCHYFIKEGNVPVTIKADNHTKGSMVDVLAPMSFFRAVTGEDDEKLVIAIVRAKLNKICRSLGVCDSSTRKGRGVWMDKGRLVLHVGDRLILDGKQYDMSRFDGEHRYRACAALSFDYTKAATAHEGEQLYDLIKMLPLARDADADLLAGWVFLAPLCGALKWRPSIWIYSERGSGKSWIVDNVVKSVLKPLVATCKGETSEAGIRQELGVDARPLVYDEAEGNDDDKSRNMRRILSLVRQSSSGGDDFAVLKGTADGRGTRYSLNTMFCLASISPAIEQAADTSRVALIELKKRSNNGDRKREFRELEARTKSLITPDYGNKITMRAVKMFPTLMETIKVFSDLVAGVFGGDQRMGDQYGTLLAGAWCLRDDTIPSDDMAMAEIAKFDWREALEINEDTDAEQCLRRLMQYKVQIRVNNEIRDIGGGTGRYFSRLHEMTVGEMIAQMFGRVNYWEEGIDTTTVDKTLRNMGLMVTEVKRNSEDLIPERRLLVQNKHERLKEVFAHTPYAVNWNKVLGKLSPDCWSPFRGYEFTPWDKRQKSRCMSIPEIDLFGERDDCE